MATVFDVARYILDRLDEERKLPVTTWKLQKLVYYSQAWSLVWDDAPLFEEPVQAWANGPACPVLYAVHRGKFQISMLPDGVGNIDNLSDTQKETIEVVLAHYGHKTAQYLSELTHLEQPWVSARGDLKPGQRGENEISLESMVEYYGSL
jgi:uncharacterized phage-associated protein